MEIKSISELNFQKIDWSAYDVIFLSCGFEDRSTYVFQFIPPEAHDRCVVLGFHPKKDILSRLKNESIYSSSNLDSNIFENPLDYEDLIRIKLDESAKNKNGEKINVFVDYSVMTRLWYGYILTWLRYSGSLKAANIDFCYAQGVYQGDFSQFQIEETRALAGFEGATAGTRRTVALYGLGYDKYATLAVHEIIQPDSFRCFMASDTNGNNASSLVAAENSQIIELSGSSPIILPLTNIKQIVDELTTVIDQVRQSDEIMVVPMGPKTHVLATLLVGHQRERLTCIHTVGERLSPIQVMAQEQISCWRLDYS